MKQLCFGLGSKGAKAACRGDRQIDAAVIVIGSDGMLSIPSEINMLLNGLPALGFAPKEAEAAGYVIGLPPIGFTYTAYPHLEKPIRSKGSLIQQALFAYSLGIKRTTDALRFPWFRTVPCSEEIEAYIQFLSALCDTAKTQRRVTSAAQDAVYEKYAFWCFFLKIGFTGYEYKSARVLLLLLLCGNAFCKNDKSMEVRI